MSESDFALGFKQGRAVEHAVMLEMIEDIKAEIIHYNDKHCNSEFISVGTVFAIIDKHIGKAEIELIVTDREVKDECERVS